MNSSFFTFLIKKLALKKTVQFGFVRQPQEKIFGEKNTFYIFNLLKTNVV